MHLGAAMLYRFQPSPLLFVVGSPRPPWFAGRDDRAALDVVSTMSSRKLHHGDRAGLVVLTR